MFSVLIDSDQTNSQQARILLHNRLFLNGENSAGGEKAAIRRSPKHTSAQSGLRASRHAAYKLLPLEFFYKLFIQVYMYVLFEK